MNKQQHPQIQRLYLQDNVSLITAENTEQIFEQFDKCLLFFCGDFQFYPESLDVAVVMPELIKYLCPEYKGIIMDDDTEGVLAKAFDIDIWPSLVFVNRGKAIGTISRMQDWPVYKQQISTIIARLCSQADSNSPLNRKPIGQRPPGPAQGK